MRIPVSVVLAATLFVGSAQAHCPATADEAMASLGPGFSAAPSSLSAWFTPRTTMFGRDVPYVVVHLHEGRVSNLFYRLNGEAGRFDPNLAIWPDRLSADLERRFRSLYSNEPDCDVPSCIAADLGFDFGVLQKVFLGPAWHEISDDWTGTALAQLRTDQTALDNASKTAIFLNCTYNLIDRRWG